MAIAVNQKHGTTNVLEVVVTEKLSHRDYETLSPEVEDMVKHFGKIRVYLGMVEFHGWEMGALGDDTKFACLPPLCRSFSCRDGCRQGVGEGDGHLMQTVHEG